MSVTGTLAPEPKIITSPHSSPLEQVIWDMSLDYNGVEKEFYSRDDIDHRVFIPSNHEIFADSDTGEIKAVDNNLY